MQFVAVYLLFMCFVSDPLPVTSCPAGCSCALADRIVCSSVTTGITLLQHIPLDIPANTTILNILDHNITRIGRVDFQNLTNLEYLQVTESNVQIIENGAFRYLTKLTHLYLYNNAISTIDRHTLVGLNTLFLLRLGNNPDLVIDRCSLSSLNRLNIFFLQDTSVTFNLSLWEDCEDQSISPAVYGIRRLSIGGEDAHISGDLLMNLSELQHLSILHPPVDLLMGYNISSLESLSRLNMEGLTFFPSDFLISDSLDTVYIARSSFTHLPAYAFTNVSTLVSCTIGGSNLAYVHKDAFRGLTSLTDLYLWSNEIQTLPVGLLTDISSPVNVRLGNNLWNCNCSLYWLISAKNKQFIVSDHPSCSSPSELAGVPLTEVDVNTTAPCDPPMTSPELTPTPHATSRFIVHPSPSEGASPRSNSPTHPTTSTDTTTAPLESSEVPRRESSLLKNWYYLALAVAVVLIILLGTTSLVCWVRATRTRKNEGRIGSGDSASGPSRDPPGIQLRGQSSRNAVEPVNSGADYYYVGDSGGEDERRDGRRVDYQIPGDSFRDLEGAASESIVHDYLHIITDETPGYEWHIQRRDHGSVHVYHKNIEDSGETASQPIVPDYLYITG